MGVGLSLYLLGWFCLVCVTCMFGCSFTGCGVSCDFVVVMHIHDFIILTV